MNLPGDPAFGVRMGLPPVDITDLGHKSPDGMQRLNVLLRRIYGKQGGRQALEKIRPLLEGFGQEKRIGSNFFSERDVVLITYADSLLQEGEKPLGTLKGFAEEHLKGVFSTIHFLPFFPYSSDDGFSVMDYFAIAPHLGTWDDVSAFSENFRLMVDHVVNHFSAQSKWFRAYLDGRPGFEDFAIEVDPAVDLSMVARPRSLPLLTEFIKTSGQSIHLWTTFSADQVDFNYRSLNVLRKMLEVILFYVSQGAGILRLDAIAYLWKEIGTACIHLPQTHDMVKLIRLILDLVAPDVILITETNVPHTDNISYFGNGRDEAQMVYNFTLPPLLLYTLAREDATTLSKWARRLQIDSQFATFLNFTASHDGIGVRPLEGILPEKEVNWLIGLAQAAGGRVAYKRNSDGSDSPYELNVTYVDAILGPESTGRVEKFLASQAIQYALPGVPATYIHSLLGSRNWYEGVALTGRPRAINRQKLQAETVSAELRDSGSFRARVFYAYRHLIKTRRKHKAFHPNADFDILTIDPRLFVIKRSFEGETLYALTNISSQPVAAKLTDTDVPDMMSDALTGHLFGAHSLHLEPYRTLWLTADS